MTVAIVSSLAAILGVVCGSFINFYLEKNRRREERAWESSAQQLRLYAEFITLASRWLMELNWASRHANPKENPEAAQQERRTLEEVHRETLVPYGMIRMTASSSMTERASDIIHLCHEHQADYEAGNLNEDALWANDAKWQTLRSAFTEEAHKEHFHYLRR